MNGAFDARFSAGTALGRDGDLLRAAFAAAAEDDDDVDDVEDEFAV